MKSGIRTRGRFDRRPTIRWASFPKDVGHGLESFVGYGIRVVVVPEVEAPTPDHELMVRFGARYAERYVGKEPSAT